MHIITKGMLLFSMLLLCFINTQAQSMDRAFNLTTRAMRLNYMPQEGFTAFDSMYTYQTGKEVMPILFTYSLISKDSNMVIGFNFLPWNYYVSETQYLLNINVDIDTLKTEITRYPERYRKRTSNADDAGVYQPGFPLGYRGRFPHCKVVFLHKQNGGDVWIYYFYTDKAGSKIDKCIRSTASMLSFKG